MHTVFRVYGNVIGRTALCSRTVGRGFKSVARIIGRGDRKLTDKERQGLLTTQYNDLVSQLQRQIVSNVQPYITPTTPLVPPPGIGVMRPADYREPETSPPPTIPMTYAEVNRQFDIEKYNVKKERAKARRKMTPEERKVESDLQQQKKQTVRDLLITRDANTRMGKKMPSDVVDTFSDRYNILHARHQSLLTKFDKLQNSTLSDQKNDEKGDELITEVETAIDQEPVGEVKETLKILKQEIHDAGYSKTVSLYKIEQGLADVVWNPAIFGSVNADGTLNPPGEIIDGIFIPTIETPEVFHYGDFFNVRSLHNSDETYSSLMNQPRLKSLYETLSPDGTYYPKVYKIPSGDIVASKGFELSLCANDELTTEILSSLYSNQNPELEPMDSICLRVGITSPTTQPFDSFSKARSSFLEFKYYKNKLYFTRSYNANKLLMKDTYQKLKATYINIIRDLKENPKNKDFKNEKKRLEQILQSSDDFERYFLQNNIYLGVFIKCTKLPEIPNETKDISNSEQQLTDYKNKKLDKSPTITFDESYKIKGITINKGKHKMADTNKYSELIGDNGCSLDFAIGCKDGIVTYSLSNDLLIKDRNIFEIYKVGEVADHQGKAHIINALNIPMHRMTLSHHTTETSEAKAKAKAQAKEAKAQATAQAKAAAAAAKAKAAAAAAKAKAEANAKAKK